jgi:FixJ family two-component response regulator
MGPLPTLVHIVDDDPSFRTTTGRLLRACGYEIAMYESAEQLLERLPDDVGSSCILLDVGQAAYAGPEIPCDRRRDKANRRLSVESGLVAMVGWDHPEG